VAVVLKSSTVVSTRFVISLDVSWLLLHNSVWRRMRPVVRRRLTRPGDYVHAGVDAQTAEDGIRQGITEIFDASVDAARWHASYARRWESVYLALGLPAAVLAAVAGATGLSGSSGRVPAAVIALVAAGLGSAATFVDSRRRGAYHRAMAANWQVLANDAHVHLLVDAPSPDWLRGPGREIFRRLSERRMALFAYKVPGDDTDQAKETS
jgi:hypothetical protein